MRKDTHFQRKKRVSEMASELYDLYMSGDIDRLGEVATEVIDLEKGHVGAITYKGIYFREKGKNKNALKFLDRALELSSREKFALVHRAAVLNHYKRHRDAMKDLEMALRVTPEDNQIISMKGDTYMRMGCWAKAQETYQEVQDLGRGNTSLWAAKIKAMKLQGLLADALEEAEMLLAETPGCYPGLWERGDILRRMKQYKEAFSTLGKARQKKEIDVGLGIVVVRCLEDWDKPDRALEVADMLCQMFPKDLHALVKQLMLVSKHDLKTVAETKFEELKNIVLKKRYDKKSPDRMMKYTGTRMKLIEELIERAGVFILNSKKYLPKESLFNDLMHEEHWHIFSEFLRCLEVAVDQERFKAEKKIRMRITKFIEKRDSKILTLKLKDELMEIDPEPGVEKYKREIVLLFRRFYESVSHAPEFASDKLVSPLEFNFIPIFWNLEKFEQAADRFTEWRNFRNYIASLREKYENFRTSNFWREAHNLVLMLKSDTDMRERIIKADKVKRVREFRERRIRERILSKLPGHFVKTTYTPVQQLAFVDMERMKEILIRSYYLPKHPHLLKLKNLFHYLARPEDYLNIRGMVMLRNAESIKKDNLEIKQILTEEAVTLTGFSYSASKVHDKKKQKDVIEVTIDSFLWDPFTIEFEGFPVEKKVHFVLPSQNYSVMVNLRIRGKKELYRRVSFHVGQLNRNAMNYVDVFEEVLFNQTITHKTKSGTIGLYIK